MAKIKNNKTGQIIEVPDSQLGQYGITLPSQNAQSQTQQTQTQETNPTISTQNYITGHSPQEHIQALQKARAAGDTQAEADINDNYNKEIAYQALNKKVTTPTAADQTRRDNLTSAFASLEGATANLTKAGGAQGPTGFGATIPIIGQYLDPEGAAYHDTKVEIATQMAKALTNSSRASESVINKYLKSLPDVNDTPEYAASKVQKLKNELAAQAKAFKYDDLVDQYNPNQPTTPDTTKTSNTGTETLNKILTPQKQSDTPQMNDPSGKKMMDSLNYAKQALTEKDPKKKAQLLQASRDAAAEGRGIQSTQQPNVLTKAGAATQDFLGNSETLPIIGSALGRGISGGNPVGTGVGASAGEYLKGILKKGGVENFVPSLGEVGGIAAKGVEYGVLDKILSVGGEKLSEAWQAKSINPTEIAGFMREKAAEATPTLDTSKIIQAGERWAKLDPQSADAWNELKSGITKDMNTKDVLDVLTAWGKRAYTTSGEIKDKAAASLMNQIYSAGRETIKEQAPEVAKYTANLRAIKELPDTMKAAQKGTWLLLKLLGIGKLM